MTGAFDSCAGWSSELASVRGRVRRGGYRATRHRGCTYAESGADIVNVPHAVSRGLYRSTLIRSCPLRACTRS